MEPGVLDAGNSFVFAMTRANRSCRCQRVIAD
jgi:hypothetical protein